MKSPLLKFTVMVLLTCFSASCTTTPSKRDAPKVSVDESLSIELRIPKDQYKATDSVDVEVVFRNHGKQDIKFSMSETDDKYLFFSFLIVGANAGHCYVQDLGEGWYDPSEKEVKMIRLKPGETYTVTLKKAVNFRATDAGTMMKEEWRIFAIYRDHSYGHSANYPEYGKNDPLVWKGVAISKPAVIKHISYVAPEER